SDFSIRSDPLTDLLISTQSTLTARAVAVGAGVFFGEGDDGVGDVFLGAGFNAFQPWGRIYFHHQMAAGGAHQVHASDIQPHGGSRFDRGASLGGCEFGDGGGAAAVQVGAKFTFLRSALHGGNNFVTNHKATYVAASGLLDKFLHQKFRAQLAECLDHTLRCFWGFRQDNTASLGAFAHL